MWCWHVIVNRQSADGYDYHKLYGAPPPAEQTIRTTSLKKGFIDQDLWRQGHSKSGTQRFFMKYRKVPCSWKMRLPCDAHFSWVENLLMFCKTWCFCSIVSCSLIEECSLVHLFQFCGKMVPHKLACKSECLQTLQRRILMEFKPMSLCKLVGQFASWFVTVENYVWLVDLTSPSPPVCGANITWLL